MRLGLGKEKGIGDVVAQRALGMTDITNRRGTTFGASISRAATKRVEDVAIDYDASRATFLSTHEENWEVIVDEDREIHDSSFK